MQQAPHLPSALEKPCWPPQASSNPLSNRLAPSSLYFSTFLMLSEAEHLHCCHLLHGHRL